MSEHTVAVVGYACRTPGTRRVEELWDLVARRRDVVTRAATNIGATPGGRVHAYGLLEDFDLFDDEFFGYAPREAAEIDPQQRLLLECAVEALEDGAVRLAGLPYEVGVYVSVGLSSYLLNTWSRPTGGQENLTTLIGGDGHYAATRIAYKLGLTGPALSVGSACSSSLVAIHSAAQAILGGECDLALAGGMDIEFPQPMSYLYQDGGILARDGVCRPFDQEATGTVFGSGGGVVLLALPEVARERGWPVRALLRGSAINNDGAEKASFTAPRGSRQRDVVRQALDAADVAPEQVGYVECHGTGTLLGDSTELNALREVFGETGLPPLGSVKANIGHLRVGAGVVSFVKACEAARRGQVPPAANVDRPLDPAVVTGEPGPLRTRGGDPTAVVAVGVSSFGFGGTNAHAVLSGPDPATPAPSQATAGKSPVVLKVSSGGPESALATARGLADHLTAHPALSVRDVAHTLDRGRDDRPYRYAVVGTDRAALIEGLRGPTRGVAEGWATTEHGKVLLVLGGQGGDALATPRALHGWEEVFTDSLDGLWARVRRLEPDTPSLADVLAGTAGLLGRGAGHALLAGTQLALADQLRARGLVPDFVCGYSLGEYPAAAVAGAMDPADVIALVLERGRLLDAAPAGDMVVLDATRQELAELLPGREPAITVSDRRQVLSVTAAELPELLDQLSDAGIGHRALGLDVPYHSDLLAGPAAELRARAARYPWTPSDALLLTAGGGLPQGPAYWSAHLSGPVDFSQVGRVAGAISQISGCTVVDLSGDGSLARAVGAGAGEEVRAAALTLFRPGRALRESYLLALASLWARGHSVDLSTPGPGERAFTALPPRAFERRRHLKDPAPRQEAGGSQAVRRTIRREPSLETWAYYPSWKLRRRVPARTDPRGERWLVFAGDGEHDARVIAGLEERGVEVAAVRMATDAAPPTGAGPRVVPGDERATKAYIAELGLDERPIRRIVHLWCLDDVDHGDRLDTRLDAMNTELAKGFYTLLYAIQEIAVRQGSEPVQVDLVAKGVHPLGTRPEDIAPERSLLLGPALVMPQDLPFTTARTIDVTGLASRDLATEILGELRAEPLDRAVTFGGGQRWSRAYERGELPRPTGDRRPARLRERGVYLITGGLGGIGMTLAEYLVTTCRARLVLTALESVPDAELWEDPTRELPEDAALAERVVRLRKLVELGGEILAVRCDAASHEQTSRLFARIDERFGALDGVVHAAGVFEAQRAFRGLEDTTAEDCVRRLRPKVDGTLVLAECLRGRKLDFVLMQSSLSAQLGGLGFYAYTAGNAYMDAFAERHRSDDIPWMSVNWDGWIFRERSDDDQRQSVVAPSFASPDFGVVAEIAVRPSEGAEIYARLMDLAEPAQVLISTADFVARHDQWVGRPLGAPGPTAPAPAAPGDPELADEVTTVVARVWREVLGVTELTGASNFFDLGGDSLLGVTLAHRLGQTFGVVMSVITMFDKPTVQAMAEELRRLGGRVPVELGGNT
ncbi:SDR family NAD(P)-dependent oxidoreductase [Streptomyces sp. NPDC057702]|uniref:SDR family NAD(P)-dependent oxidoreductase n=1 Tax=unclassified Streptomyces TaxID=2593676 RepID=UPI0036C34B92